MANIFKSKFTGEQIEDILDKANNVTDIQANNGEPTTADLSTLKIGNVNYKIPETSTPSETTEVEANPTGVPTGILNSIRIDEIIYRLPDNSDSAESTFTLTLNIRNNQNSSYQLPINANGESLTNIIRKHLFYLWNIAQKSIAYINLFPASDWGVRYRTITLGATSITLTDVENVESITRNGSTLDAINDIVMPNDNVEIILYTWSSGGSN